MAEKLKHCPVCGAEIASKAKTCPQCGAKNKQPIYKKWWFYVIIVIIVVGALGNAGGSSSNSDTSSTSSSASSDTSSAEADQSEAEAISYEHHNVTELFDALSSNALKAEKTYQDQYVELEGYLSVIDSDGKYIGIGAASDDWDYLLQTVQCYIKSEDQLDQILEMSTGDSIVVRGKITSIGEIIGYSLKIDSIN